MPRKAKSNNKGFTPDLMQKMVTAMAAMKMAPVAAPKPKKRRNRRRRNAVSSEGEITLTRKELLKTITVPAGKDEVAMSINLRPDEFPFLKGLGDVFERVRWLKMTIHYKPAVSLTTAGLVALGVDWDSKSAATTREKVAAYTPSSTFAVWQDTEKQPMVLPPAKLQSRAWYSMTSSENTDRQPGQLVVAATGPPSSTLGELYCTYTVQMMGTRA